MAVRSPQFVRLIGAVDIDESAARIDDPAGGVDALVAAWLQAFKPEDARGDQVILRRGPFASQLAGRLPSLEDHAGRGAVADLLADPMETVGSLQGILDAPTAGPGGADRIGFAVRTTEMPEFLLVNRHNDAIFRRRQTEPLQASSHLFLQT